MTRRGRQDEKHELPVHRMHDLCTLRHAALHLNHGCTNKKSSMTIGGGKVVGQTVYYKEIK